MSHGGDAVSLETEAAALRLPAGEISKLTELLRAGQTAPAHRQIEALAATVGEGGVDAVRTAVVTEPQLNRSLSQLETWLDGTIDTGAAAPIGAWWALPASGINLEEAVNDARLFIDNYPTEGRKIPILQAAASDWLVRRFALLFDNTPYLPPIRAAITMLSEAARPMFPQSARTLDAVLEQYDDDKLWYSVAEMIVRSQLVLSDIP